MLFVGSPIFIQEAPFVIEYSYLVIGDPPSAGVINVSVTAESEDVAFDQSGAFGTVLVSTGFVVYKITSSLTLEPKANRVPDEAEGAGA